MPRRLFAAAALAASACFSDWKEVDFCPSSGCTTCHADSDCGTGSSCCSEELYCSHRADGPIVCELGCDVPDPPACSCVGGRCRFE